VTSVSRSIDTNVADSVDCASQADRAAEWVESNADLRQTGE